LVYTDLSGPISPASGAVNSYVAKFTDPYTRLKSVCFLSKKNEAIDALMNYTQDVVFPSGHRLQRLRSDRGGENTGLEYREYCLQTGIKQEFAATNTPQQNGISEREWASLWNMTRCFLAEAGVPKFLWQEAFRMAVYLANRVPSTPLGGKTPFSMWHGGTPPSLEHLRTNYEGREGRMVGYGKDSKIYRVRESGTKIVESRNVTFIETLPVKLNTLEHDHNDSDDGTFLDLESSSISLGTQEEMPETEADAEMDTGGSQTIYPSTLDYAYIIGHPLIDIPNTREVSFTPRNHREAMASAQASEWQASMERELASMSKHDVYELIPAPKGRKIIGSMWVFKVKPDGLYKSRFCAQGFSQVAGTDFGSTYAPVCRIPSVRIVLAIAASHDW
ncbi:unnamed protein product, partial [Laminaria digitata]